MRTPTDKLLAVLVLALAAGCSGNPADPSSAAFRHCSALPGSHDGPRLLDLERPLGDEPPVLTGMSGAAPRPGEAFILLSIAGYLGTVEVTAERQTSSCADDCPAFWVLTKWRDDGPQKDHARAIERSEPTYPPGLVTYALGLVPKDPTRIRVESSGPGDPPVPPGWRQSFSLDLDGDQRSDIVLLSRRCDCGRLTEMKVREGETWALRDRDFVRSVFAPRDPKLCEH